jgi:hypothetical protein
MARTKKQNKPTAAPLSGITKPDNQTKKLPVQTFFTHLRWMKTAYGKVLHLDPQSQPPFIENGKQLTPEEKEKNNKIKKCLRNKRYSQQKKEAEANLDYQDNINHQTPVRHTNHPHLIFSQPFQQQSQQNLLPSFKELLHSVELAKKQNNFKF